MKSFLEILDIIDLTTYLGILLVLCALESIFVSSSDFLVELDIWIIPLVFYFLHRQATTALILAVLSAFVLSGFSGMPTFQGVLGLLNVLIFVLIFKNHSFLKGSSYLYFTTMISLPIFYITTLIANYIFYSNLTSMNFIMPLILITLISPSFAFILEPGLKFIDKLIGVKYPFGFEA